MLVFRGSCPEAKGSCYCLSSGGRPSSVLIKRLGMASIICCTFFRSSSNLARHICLRDHLCINRLKAISEGLLHSHWSSGYYDECANSPIGRNNGATFQHLSMDFRSLCRRKHTCREASYNADPSPSSNPVHQATPHTRYTLKILSFQIMSSYSLAWPTLRSSFHPASYRGAHLES